MPVVPFNEGNLKECQCPKCPVEIRSVCAENQLEETEIQLLRREMPSEEDSPELYCSKGLANCLDIDPSRACVCPTCPVWAKQKLSAKYYCVSGSAEENG